VVLTASIGSLTYGYNISILGNALSKPAFYAYLDLVPVGNSKTEALVAAWNCMLYVGGMIGCVCYPWISNRYGRKLPIFLSSVSVIIGGGMQAGMVNSAMLCVARVIQGLSNGLVLSGIPLYQAEVAPPSTRGLMVGLHGKDPYSLEGFQASG
jgi:MFS family permease